MDRTELAQNLNIYMVMFLLARSPLSLQRRLFIIRRTGRPPLWWHSAVSSARPALTPLAHNKAGRFARTENVHKIKLTKHLANPDFHKWQHMSGLQSATGWEMNSIGSLPWRRGSNWLSLEQAYVLSLNLQFLPFVLCQCYHLGVLHQVSLNIWAAAIITSFFFAARASVCMGTCPYPLWLSSEPNNLT